MNASPTNKPTHLPLSEQDTYKQTTHTLQNTPNQSPGKHKYIPHNRIQRTQHQAKRTNQPTDKSTGISCSEFTLHETHGPGNRSDGVGGSAADNLLV